MKFSKMSDSQMLTALNDKLEREENLVGGYETGAYVIQYKGSDVYFGFVSGMSLVFYKEKKDYEEMNENISEVVSGSKEYTDMLIGLLKSKVVLM